MAKYTIILCFSVFLLHSCRPIDQPVAGMTIDPAIKSKAEKRMGTTAELEELRAFKDLGQLYINTGEVEYYENDSLVIDSRTEGFQAPFKSFYGWYKDTLIIDGAFGMFGGSGFVIRIHNNKATLYHMLASDDFPTYAYRENDSLVFRLEVPCTNTKIVLSALPDSSKKQVIYGYVEFKSADYYASEGSINDEEILPRKKMRANMKLYFKSGYLNL